MSEEASKISPKAQDIIKSIEKMTILEVSQLVTALEEKFGVSAAAPAAVSAGGGNGSQAKDQSQEEAKSEFDVVILAPGENRIAAIKAVREINPHLGLKEAKDLVESAPKAVVEGVKKDDAEEAKKKLEEAGAKVELK